MRFNLVEGGRGGLNAVLRWKENFQIRVCRGRQSWLGRPDNIGFSSILGYETMGCETKGRRKLHTRIFPRNDVKDREDCNKMKNLGKVLMIAVASVCC